MPVAYKEHRLASSPHVKAERESLAEKLIAFRSEHNIARRVVADLVGCSQSNIKCIECLESDPSFALLKTLEKLMSLPREKAAKLIAENEAKT